MPPPVGSAPLARPPPLRRLNLRRHPAGRRNRTSCPSSSPPPTRPPPRQPPVTPTIRNATSALSPSRAFTTTICWLGAALPARRRPRTRRRLARPAGPPPSAPSDARGGRIGGATAFDARGLPPVAFLGCRIRAGRRVPGVLNWRHRAAAAPDALKMAVGRRPVMAGRHSGRGKARLGGDQT